MPLKQGKPEPKPVNREGAKSAKKTFYSQL
jgi:hypothetical protein